MKQLSIMLLLLLPAPLGADDTRCDDIVNLAEVRETCGVEFVRAQARERKSRCSVSYHVADFEGISPEMVFSTDNRVNSKGRVMASTRYGSSINGARESGRFLGEIPGLGEAAYYSEYDIHMEVTWYEGSNFNVLDVQKGKRYEGEWRPACSRDQIIEIARSIRLSGQ